MKKTFAFILLGATLALAQAASAAEAPTGFVIHESPMPLSEIQFQDADDRALDLAAFHSKVVLLNIWATWCAPCRKEMPTLDRLQMQLGGPDFQVVTLSIDQGGPATVQRFFAEIGIQYLSLYIDPSANAARALRVAGLPTTLLIDRQGRELGRFIGPAEWDTPDMIAFLKSIITQQTGASTAP